MRAAIVFLTFQTVIFAGCVTTGDNTLQPAPVSPPSDDARVVRHDAEGNWIAPGADPVFEAGLVSFDRPPYPNSLLTGSHPSTGGVQYRGEPTLGVDAAGRIFYQSWESILRSTDQGRSWQLVNTAPATMDPVMHVDVTTGRVFSDHLYLEAGCTHLSWSDDGGATWTTNPLACASPGIDHQKLVTAPPRQSTAPSGYQNLVFLAFNEDPGTRIAVSRDGGLTWPQEHQVLPRGHGWCDSGLHGPLRAGPDGILYLPKSHCEGFVLLRSLDSGATWSTHPVGQDAGGGTCRPDPDLAIDAFGHLYGVWQGADQAIHLSASTDAGSTWWPRSLRVTPPNVHTTTFPAIAAGDSGRVAIAYYGTTTAADGADHAPADTVWHLYVTIAEDLASPQPTFLTVRLTDDPIQVGPIWTHYTCAAARSARNHLDFISASTDNEGRVLVAYTDGCIGPCAEQPTMRTSRASEPAFAIVRSPSLRSP